MDLECTPWAFYNLVLLLLLVFENLVVFVPVFVGQLIHLP